MLCVWFNWNAQMAKDKIEGRRSLCPVRVGQGPSLSQSLGVLVGRCSYRLVTSQIGTFLDRPAHTWPSQILGRHRKLGGAARSRSFKNWRGRRDFETFRD